MFAFRKVLFSLLALLIKARRVESKKPIIRGQLLIPEQY